MPANWYKFHFSTIISIGINRGAPFFFFILFFPSTDCSYILFLSSSRLTDFKGNEIINLLTLNDT